MQDTVIIEQPKQSPLFIQEDKIDSCLMQIQAFLEDDIKTDAPEEIKKMLGQCYSWLANSANLVASTRYYLEERKKLAFKLGIEEIVKIPASTVKIYVESLCSVEIARYEYAQRQNACITHRTEGLRSLLSFAKEEMNQIRIGTITK